MTDYLDPTTIQKLWQAIEDLQNNPPLADHRHNKFDSSPVAWGDLTGRLIYWPYTLPGTSPATTGNYGTIFVAPFAMNVTGFTEVHQTAGTDGSAVTLQLEKLTGTTAPGAGTALLSTALSLKAAINTVQTGVLVTTAGTRTLAKSDRLALKLSGTPTSVAGVTGFIELTVI